MKTQRGRIMEQLYASSAFSFAQAIDIGNLMRYLGVENNDLSDDLEYLANKGYLILKRRKLNTQVFTSSFLTPEGIAWIEQLGGAKSSLIDQEQYRHLISLVARRAGILTQVKRENLLDLAGLGRFKEHLNFDTDARSFAIQLVRVLQQHGTLAETGRPALVSLLIELREIVAGHQDEAAFLDRLLK